MSPIHHPQNWEKTIRMWKNPTPVSPHYLHPSPVSWAEDPHIQITNRLLSRSLTTLILTFYHPGVLRERFGKLVDMPPGIQNRSRDLASRGNISGSSNPSRPVRHSGTSDTSRLQEFPTPSINSSVCGSTIFDLWKNPSEISKVSDSYQFQHIPTIPIPEKPFLVKGNLVVKFYSIIVV